MNGSEAAARADELLVLVELEDAADRLIKGYSRRHEAAAGPGERARPPPRGAVPRRAHHGPGPRLPDHGVGGGPPHQRSSARPSSSPRSTSRRPTSSAAGSRSSTTAGSSARARRAPEGRAARTRRRSTTTRRSTTCSSTPPAAPARRPRAPCRRWSHEPDLGARPARAARGVADAGGDPADAVHPAVLPRGQHRPGGQDLPVGVHGVPQGPGLRRVPAARRRLLLAASLRHRRALPRRGHRGRLLRQAARRAGLALRARARPPGRRVRQGHRDLDRDHRARHGRSASTIASGVARLPAARAADGAPGRSCSSACCS